MDDKENTELKIKYRKVINVLKLMIVGNKDRNPETRLALGTLIALGEIKDSED